MTHEGWHSRGYLPHFDAKGVVQHIVFHTRTALSHEFLLEVAKLNINEKRKRLDSALDASTRCTILSNARCAAAVEAQLRHFDG